MKCTECNDKGYIELLMSRKPCECQESKRRLYDCKISFEHLSKEQSDAIRESLLDISNVGAWPAQSTLKLPTAE